MSLTLLRNCAVADGAPYQLAVKLLTALLVIPKLRHGLRGELGALFPLLLLRPLEQERVDVDVAVSAVVPALRSVCSEPQLLVDLFVNYDCDLQVPGGGGDLRMIWDRSAG